MDAIIAAFHSIFQCLRSINPFTRQNPTAGARLWVDDFFIGRYQM
jgi:hypothetical protein